MSSNSLSVVQFIHPGFEYSRPERFPYSGSAYMQKQLGRGGKRSGVMGWKPGNAPHNRKFMLSHGSLLDPSSGRDMDSVVLAFWGEWEGPSIYWRVRSASRALPSIVHAPFRPAGGPTRPVQNTDPLVFGKTFVYSNCLQRPYASLRSLSPGSMVLFGRYAKDRGRPFFSLDSCLVIDRFEYLSPSPFESHTFGADLLLDAVLGPLHSEGTRQRFTVYFGRPPSSTETDPFSFFPARVLGASLPLFSRPEITPSEPLEDVINSKKNQGIKITGGLSVADRDAIWNEVVRQVSENGCGLGYHAAPPPLLTFEDAEEKAGDAPGPVAV